MAQLPRQAKTRQTKIVCTLGPATTSPERIRQLILAGMDVARLNFSHGDAATHRNTIRSIRTLSRELGREIGILQDLAGPKIRLGMLPVPERELRTGDRVAFSPGESRDPAVIPVDYPYLLEDVAVGNRILLADGLVELEAEAIAGDRLVCRVIAGGVISSRKGMNLPLSHLRIPSFTDKDREDLRVGLEEGVDFVGVSFVRHEKDLEPIHEMIRGHGGARPLVIAKIEKPEAVERLAWILNQVDGLMVARGDLGVEVPLEEVPIIQKRIIRAARRAGKPVITATQMLRSMVSSPRPTRAEAADVANAVLDGTDAVMLSEESAVGDYPIEAVAMLDRIARVAEPHRREADLLEEPDSRFLRETEACVSRAAARLAYDLKAAAIVAFTQSGKTARFVARFRPDRPVIALTPSLETQRQLSLSSGVIPTRVESFSGTDQIFALVSSWAVEKGVARKGDRLVVTAGVPLGTPSSTNLLRVLEV